MANVRKVSELKQMLQQKVAEKKQRLTEALVRCGLLLQAESQKIVPVDYGFLKNSAFTRKEGSTDLPAIVVGYTSVYAIYVHENLEAAHGVVFNQKYAAELAHAAKLRKQRKGGTKGPFRHDRGPDQQAKFLERPFRRLRQTFVAIVKDGLK